MSKPQKFCVYCGGSGMSKEHIFPDWLAPYVPRTRTTNTEHFQLLERDGTPRQELFRKQQGDPYTRKLRVVCQECNNGWMSRLQTETKPILLPLLTGQSTTLYRKQQTILARWIAMSIMTADFRPPADPAISQGERARVMAGNRVGSNWRIWIGNYERKRWPAFFTHHTIPINSPRYGISVSERDPPLPNTQSSSFVVGPLFIVAISSAIPRLAKKWTFNDASEAVLRQIWPIQRPSIAWPLPAMTDEEADRISSAFFRKFIQKHVLRNQ
jgi:hypothetical protein